MFSEPLTITVDGVAQALKRTDFNPGRFQLPSGDLVLSIDQQVNKQSERFNVQFVRNVLAADPMNPAVYRQYQRKYWFGSSGPLNGIGISDVQAEKDAKGLFAWLNTAGVLLSLYGGEK